MGRAKEWVVQQKTPVTTHRCRGLGPGPVAAAGYGRGAAAAGAHSPLCAPAAGHHLARGWVLVHHLVHLSEDCRRVPAGSRGSAWGLARLAGRFPLFEILFRPWAVMIKSIPVASFIIICLIWMSSARLSIFISFLMVLPIIYSNVLQSIHSVDRQMLEAVKVFRLSWPQTGALYLWLPQLKPYLLSACGVSLGISWKAGIAAEIIGIPAGSIGRMFYDAKVYFNTVDLFAWTVIVVVISVLFEKRLPGPAAGGLSKGGNTVNDLILEQVTKGFWGSCGPARILCPVSRGAVYLHHGALRLRENYPCFVSSWGWSSRTADVFWGGPSPWQRCSRKPPV